MSTRIGDWLFGRVGEETSEARAMQVYPWGDWGGGSSSTTGRTVTPSSASQLLTVFGCTQFIADTIATLPRGVFTDSPDKTEIENVPPWFRRPNPTTTMTEYIGQAMWSLLMDGNIFAPYSTDASFRTNGLTILDPRSCDVREDTPGRPTIWVNGKQFVGNMKHVKGLTQPGASRGLNPIEAARQSISIALEAQDFAARFYSNGASLSHVIKSPRDLTLPQARELAEKFGRNHSGANAHKPGIVDGGADIVALSITPEQSQFLETRKYQDADIAGKLFLLDPTLIGIPTSISETYANLEQRGIHFVTFTLLRWLVRLEEFFTELLPAAQYMKFNVAGLMRADLLTRYQAHQIALGGPQGSGVKWMTVEEVRELEDLGPIPTELKGQLAPKPAPIPPVAPVASNGNGTPQMMVPAK